MLKLHGFSASNYYNVVKLALLEKGLPFEEVPVYVGASAAYRPDYLKLSPIGKVPCLETSQGVLTESRCILEYLESLGGVPLFLAEPFARAKQLELMQGIELYLELQARRLIPNFFARKPPSERVGNEILAELAKGARILSAWCKFDPFVLGETFTAADISLAIHVPVVRHIIGSLLGKDPLADVAGLDEYLQRIEQRPAVQRVRAEQRADFPRFIQHLSSLAPG